MAGTLTRIVWFLLIGWWLGLLWFSASLVLMGSIVFFPAGAYLAAKTWGIMTLSQSPEKVVVEAKEQKN